MNNYCHFACKLLTYCKYCCFTLILQVYVPYLYVLYAYLLRINGLQLLTKFSMEFIIINVINSYFRRTNTENNQSCSKPTSALAKLHMRIIIVKAESLTCFWRVPYAIHIILQNRYSQITAI